MIALLVNPFGYTKSVYGGRPRVFEGRMNVRNRRGSSGFFLLLTRFAQIPHSRKNEKEKNE